MMMVELHLSVQKKNVNPKWKSNVLKHHLLKLRRTKSIGDVCILPSFLINDQAIEMLDKN